MNGEYDQKNLNVEVAVLASEIKSLRDSTDKGFSDLKESMTQLWKSEIESLKIQLKSTQGELTEHKKNHYSVGQMIFTALSFLTAIGSLLLGLLHR